MLFNSPVYFFAFLPVAVVVFYLLQTLRLPQAAKVWLIAASLFFYSYWNIVYLPLIIGSIVVNYAVAHRIQRSKSGFGPRWITARTALIAGVTFNLGLLGYFKYSDFFIANVNLVFGSDLPLLHLLLPLAISFFTFQQIAYLVDCYRYDVHDYSFLNYCLFVSFFPQLIAGPIVHHREMMPQFADSANSRLQLDNIARGLLLFSIGLFKKVVIADTFAIWADAGYASNDPLTTLAAWQATLSYTFQLYYDFSGYTDMAIGAALMFNIRLPLNFNSPYKAHDIQDFWRRWHMTLSRWLRDYLYIPLGGNRAGSGRTYVNLFLTFLLGGLWHGAGWTFIIWGAMHGAALALHRFWSRAGFTMPVLVAWPLTFLFVHFAWVMFRAEELEVAVAMYAGMLGMNGSDATGQFMTNLAYYRDLLGGEVDLQVDLLLGAFGTTIATLLFGVIALFFRNSIQMVADKTRFSVVDAVIVAVSFLLAVLLSIGSTSSVFLYFNF